MLLYENNQRPGEFIPVCLSDFVQLVFSSDPWNSYLQAQIKSLSVTDEQKNDTQAFITVRSNSLTCYVYSKKLIYFKKEKKKIYLKTYEYEFLSFFFFR